MEDYREKIRDQEKRIEELTRENEELEIILEENLRISSILELHALIKKTLDTARNLVGAQTASFFLNDKDSGNLIMYVALDKPGEKLVNRILKKGVGIAGRVAVTQKPAIVNDVLGDPDFYEVFDLISGFQTKSIMAIPLMIMENLVGVVELVNKTAGGKFEDKDLRRISALGNVIAIAVENALLYREAQEIGSLKKISRFKTQMMRLVSHEMKTPLSSIIAYTGVLKTREFPPEERAELLDSVCEEARRMARLVDAFLNVSSLEEGKIELHTGVMDFPKLFDELKNTFQPLLKNHTLEISIAENLPPVIADKERIHQVLENLVSNAIKFSPGGGAINIEVVPWDNQIKVSVSDKGIGISEAEQERIFDHFYRVYNEECEEIKGSGLGLTLAKLLAELHGGRMWVESCLGKGSTFCFVLPVKK